ncbi:hypothetical protein BTM25_18330 [Actinomadura rubteroloni]|uniref:Uncharacterized protein n=1 Tax=Actinomadura rubteroloni TaxID=1926885 RepID=A0A2P4UQU2_9ACTN|nr:hypothetical protein [Actinomadura rubteroloni]POM27419.1 hypothetical protein BTM25_18330 [Actinomadura rubteroloni]
MSDQGERPRWAESDDAGEGTPEPGRQAGAGRSSEEDGHDVWGKVEEPRDEHPDVRPAETAARIEPKTVPEPRGLLTATPGADEPEDEPGTALEPVDRKVAPVPSAPAWEGELFDGDADGDGDTRYVAPSGDAGPGKPGRPSSGNWQMPSWMADEESADRELEGSTADAPFDEPSGRSRILLFGGIGLLVVALAAAGGVYYLKHRGSDPAPKGSTAGLRRTSAPAGVPAAELPPDRPLRTFAGTPSRVAGHVSDTGSGLLYPRFARPWQTPTKKNKLAVPGWSGQQILVTERHAGRIWYGQFLTGTLQPTLRSAYSGPQSVKTVTAMAAKGLEESYYAFPHRSAPLASEALTVGGHRGWLVASYYAYKRPPFRATGEVVATAVIDTGRGTPALVFASLPNTNKKLWPDLNRFFAQLKVLPAS